MEELVELLASSSLKKWDLEMGAAQIAPLGLARQTLGQDLFPFQTGFFSPKSNPSIGLEAEAWS